MEKYTGSENIHICRKLHKKASDPGRTKAYSSLFTAEGKASQASGPASSQGVVDRTTSTVLPNSECLCGLKGTCSKCFLLGEG